MILLVFLSVLAVLANARPKNGIQHFIENDVEDSGVQKTRGEGGGKKQ
ncbi:hypothetical protein CAEBREN_15983 [Caenorhabditis brenneri]|uniref:Uncharacterized protein n=1 Tax=Caenorhabditis brenneri TaxID=135651 RepID=G0MJ81_CAEBE|nr:hypothetical protein CAEBREN_15983 [Caenorhabditis brenneri]